MKISLFLTLLLFFLISEAQAQVVLKHEYFGQSTYRDKGNWPTNNEGKGSANVYSGIMNIPLSLKVNENKRVTMWSAALGGSYASLNNKYFDEANKPLDEILNMVVSINHLRPLKDKMSILLSLGAGVYMDDTRFSQIRGRHILGNGAAVIIWHLNPKLDLGAGLALNNTFGYPMVFPALYLKWNLYGKFNINASLISGVNLSAGYNFSNHFNLNFITEMNGQMALLEGQDHKDMVFTHQYIVVGLRPNFVLNKHFSLSLTAGINAVRNAYYKRRTMKAFFSKKDKEHSDPYFKTASYVSTSVSYKF